MDFMPSVLPEQLSAFRRLFHKHAESGFSEFWTTAFLARQISEAGCSVKVGSAAICREARMGVPREEVQEARLAKAVEQGADPKWDLIILDPPSFTRNKKSLNGAMRGYKEIHLRARQMLPVGGLLSTFCCSHHVSASLFRQTIADAAVDGHSTLRQVAAHGQSVDHPVLLNIPETEYLTGFTFEMVPGR